MKNIQDIYPLTPMQESMLLHAISHTSSDVLFSQFCYEIDGSINSDLFQEAWARLTQRHPILRTAFFWTGLKQPIQVVHKTVTIPFQNLDWRNQTDEQQQQLLRTFRKQDRDIGFDFTKAPLTRLAVVSLSHTKQVFVWTTHHLLLDRWCLQALHSELRLTYLALIDECEPELPRSVPFRRYIDWLLARPDEEAHSYWQLNLSGFKSPTNLTSTHSNKPTDAALHYQTNLSLKLTSQLRSAAAARRVTSSVVLQAAWALTLARYTGQTDVVFGITSSGRPPDLTGVESIMGSFINNLPLRVSIDFEVSVEVWLQSLQKEQHARANVETVAVADLHRYTNVPDNLALFDSLLVWLSSVDQLEEGDNRLIMRGLTEVTNSAYPLTISVTEFDQTLELEVQLVRSYVACQPIGDLLESLKDCVDILTRNCSAGSLRSCLEAEAGFAEIISMPSTRHCEGRTDNTYTLLPTNANLLNVAHKKSTSIEGRNTAREHTEQDFMEELLRGEWQGILGTPQFDDESSFFDLGGTSIMAAILHARLEASTRSSIPLLTLFSNPTFGAMVTSLTIKDWPMKPDILIPITTHGNEPALFCVASPDVNTLGFSQLSRQLTTARPVFVLQAPPDRASMRRLSPKELPALAWDYVQAMRNVQPEGPYNLIGMCDGSQIALEMARHLEASHEKTSFLGIINTWALYTVSPLYYFQRYRYTVDRLLSIPADQRLSAIIHRLFSPSTFSATYPPITKTPNETTGEVSGKSMCEKPRDEWIHIYGWHHLNPKKPKIKQRITVFRIASHSYWRVPDRTLGWKLHADDIDVVRLAYNDHDKLLRLPSVKDVANKVDAALSGNK